MQPFRHKCHGTCEMRGAQLICIPLHPVSARLMWLPVRIPGTRGMMDVFAVLGGCMNRMFAGVEGMKILLVDHETSGIISLVMSQSRLFELDVFLVDYLDNEHRQKQKNLVCVCLLRPTSENFEVLAAELSDPKYGSYHLFFTNVVKHTQLERMAEADEHEVVKDFQEVFCDYYPVHESIFSFNEESLRMHLGINSNRSFSRVVDGVASVFFASKQRPALRYAHKSTNCALFAKEVENCFDLNSDYFSARTHGEQPVLLILDRCDDPITPLLTQWTYQAMIHEFFVIRNGRVRMETPGAKSEFVMNFDQDAFYGENLSVPIWSVAENVQRLVERYQRLTQQSTNFDSIADMKKFMEDYPEYKRLSMHVSKHVTLASELMKLSEKCNLQVISQFEQEVVSGTEMTAEGAWQRLNLLLGDPHTPHYHKLRLCLIVLCQVGIHEPLDRLSLLGFSDDDIAFLKYVYLTRSSRDQTSASSLLPANMINRSKSWISGSTYPDLKGMLTPLTRHIPKLFETVDQLIRDKLSESMYPYLSDCRPVEKPREIVVFVLGGTTYEEARFVSHLNQIYPSVRVLLGSNFIHNNRSFIAEMFNEWVDSRSSQ